MNQKTLDTSNGRPRESPSFPAEDTPEVIGTVKGPGETSNQYVFITSNTQAVKVGDFVYYEVRDSQFQPLKILGKIRQVQLLDHIPTASLPTRRSIPAPLWP